MLVYVYDAPRHCSQFSETWVFSSVRWDYWTCYLWALATHNVYEFPNRPTYSTMCLKCLVKILLIRDLFGSSCVFEVSIDKTLHLSLGLMTSWYHQERLLYFSRLHRMSFSGYCTASTHAQCRCSGYNSSSRMAWDIMELTLSLYSHGASLAMSLYKISHLWCSFCLSYLWSWLIILPVWQTLRDQGIYMLFRSACLTPRFCTKSHSQQMYPVLGRSKKKTQVPQSPA